MAKLIENRCFDSSNIPHLILEHFKYHDLVTLSFKPAAWQVQCLLWTDVPVSAQIMAINEYDSFAPFAHVQEAVSSQLKIKKTAIKTWEAKDM